MNMSPSIPPIRIVVVSEHEQERQQAIDVAVSLSSHPYFEVAIVACATRSSWVMGSPVLGGLPAMNIDTGVTLQQVRDETKHGCAEIIKSLNKALPKNEGPDVGYIEGSTYRIAAKLSSCFDLVVMPRGYAAEFYLSGFDLQMATSRYAPTLFCADPSKWQSLIVTRLDNTSCWWAAQFAARISTVFGLSVHTWVPYVLSEPPSQSRDSDEWEQLATADRLEQLDVGTMPEAEQATTCLLVPAEAVRARFRYRKIRRILRDWRGSCLVWP